MDKELIEILRTASGDASTAVMWYIILDFIKGLATLSLVGFLVWKVTGLLVIMAETMKNDHF